MQLRFIMDKATSIIMTLIAYFALFILGVLLGKYSNWIFYVNNPLDLKSISDGLNALFIGISALITTSLIWYFIARKIYLVSLYRRKYPAQKRNESNSFRLIRVKPNDGEVYLLDEKTKSSHHIENESTMRDLYFYRGYVKECEPSEFKNYEQSSPIDSSIDILKYFPLVKI